MMIRPNPCNSSIHSLPPSPLVNFRSKIIFRPVVAFVMTDGEDERTNHHQQRDCELNGCLALPSPVVVPHLGIDRSLEWMAVICAPNGLAHMHYD